MEEKGAIRAFAALAHPTRLAVVRYLVRHLPGDVPALEIGEALGAKPSTLSGHLTVLREAGVLVSERRHREIRYRVDLDRVGALVTFLLADCCGGRTECCGDLGALLGAADG